MTGQLSEDGSLETLSKLEVNEDNELKVMVTIGTFSNDREQQVQGPKDIVRSVRHSESGLFSREEADDLSCRHEGVQVTPRCGLEFTVSDLAKS